MAQKHTYDTSLKLFILNSGVTAINTVVDIYSDAKEDWRTDPLLNKFTFPVIAVGGQGIGGGQVISPYIILRNGWKIRPQEADHTLTVTGNLITDDETSPFADVLGDYQVIIKNIVTSNSLTNASSTVNISENDMNTIADKVLDELVSAHQTSGSVGEILTQIKKKTTLASLK